MSTLLVIDRSALESTDLDSYLRGDRRNRAVFTDFLARDIFSAPDTALVKRAFSVVTRYAGQVDVLKSTDIISRLVPRRSRRLVSWIDVEQTRNFPAFCAAVNTPTPRFTRSILEKSGIAHRYLENLLTEAEVVAGRLKEEVAKFPADGVDAIRRQRKASPSFSAFLHRSIINDTKRLLASNGITTALTPDFKDVVFSFQYRFALATHIHVLFWVQRGSLPENSSKLRNTINDMGYVAYASFFDGIMTNDRRLAGVHSSVMSVLSTLVSV